MWLWCSLTLVFYFLRFNLRFENLLRLSSRTKPVNFINVCLPQRLFSAIIQNPIQNSHWNQRDANFRVILHKYVIATPPYGEAHCEKCQFKLPWQLSFIHASCNLVLELFWIYKIIGWIQHVNFNLQCSNWREQPLYYYYYNVVITTYGSGYNVSWLIINSLFKIRC